MFLKKIHRDLKIKKQIKIQFYGYVWKRISVLVSFGGLLILKMKLIRKLKFSREMTYLTLYSINLNGCFPIHVQAHILVRYIWVIFATIECFYMSGLSIVEAFLKNYGFLINITIVLNVLTSCVCYIAPIISLYSRKKLIKLIKLLDSGFYSYSDEHTFQMKEYSANDLLNKELVVCGFVFVTYIGMTLTPLVVTLMLKDHENSVFDLLYVAWVPFGIETGQQFFFSYILQFISTIPLYTSFCSKILFINNISLEFRYQCDKLKYALSTICQRVSQKTEIEDTISNRNAYSANGSKIVICDENEFLQKFSECVKHYRQLDKFLDYFSFWFNLIFSCELTYGFLSFALIGYVLITGTGNSATDGKYVCLLGLFGGQLCYQCVAGEIIFTIEETVTNELYNIPWYEQTPKVKKSVQIFLNELQQHRKLRGFHIFPASIPIFASIARTSYSYLNLLSKMIRKNEQA